MIVGHQEEMFAIVSFLECIETHLTYWEFGCTLLTEIRFHLCILQMVRYLTRLEQHIEGHYHSSCFEDSIVHNWKVRDILATYSNSIPFLDSQLYQGMSNLVGSSIQLSVG